MPPIETPIEDSSHLLLSIAGYPVADPAPMVPDWGRQPAQAGAGTKCAGMVAELQRPCPEMCPGPCCPDLLTGVDSCRSTYDSESGLFSLLGLLNED